MTLYKPDKDPTHQLTSWTEVRIKSAAKGGMNLDKRLLNTTNEFSVLHDHNIRLVAAGGGGQGASRAMPM